MTDFHDFKLNDAIARALTEEKYVTPTPIQAQTIPTVMSGRDVIGIAQTGTGKTAAFALPILHRLADNPRPLEHKTCRVLVLSPTRELSGQILDSFRTYGRHLRFRSALAIGGVSMGAQVRSLMNGVDILVATPGRLLDLVHSNALRLNGVECFVLDEADRMLDMGFINDIRKIVAKLPANRQTLMFSATMPGAIADLAAHMLRDPVKVAVTPTASTAERIDQRIIRVDRAAKPAILVDLLRQETIDRALVFTRTKHGADKVVRRLDASRHRRGGHPRQQVARPARARAGGVPHRQGEDAGRHRYRRARHRRRRHQPCGEFRSAERAGNLRASHRPHGARRRGRHRHLAVRRRGDGVSARHRKAHPHVAADQRSALASAARGGARRRSCAWHRTAPGRHNGNGNRGQQRRRNGNGGGKQQSHHGQPHRDRPHRGESRRGEPHTGQQRTGSRRPIRRKMPASPPSPSCAATLRKIAVTARRALPVNREVRDMAKEELLEFEGLVTEILPDARFRVQLDNGHALIAYTAGRMKKNRIKTLAGDRVTVEVSPYDLEKGRMIFRHKDERAGTGPRPQRHQFRRR